MSDLVLPFLLLIDDDALAFASFKSLMQKVRPLQARMPVYTPRSQ